MIFICIRISHVIFSMWQWVRGDGNQSTLSYENCRSRSKQKRDFRYMRNSSFRNMHLYSVDLRSDWLIRKNRPIPKSIIRKCSANNRINSIRTYLNGTEQIRTDTNWYEEICIFRPVWSNMWVSLNKHIGHMVPHVYNLFLKNAKILKKTNRFLEKYHFNWKSCFVETSWRYLKAALYKHHSIPIIVQSAGACSSSSL